MNRKELTAAERTAWLRLSRTENIGPITFYKLIERYGSAEKALERLPDLSKRGGRAKPLSAISKDEAEDEVESLEKIDGRLIAHCEPDYPPLLATIEDAPPLIAVIGHAHLLQRPCVAIVGARNASLNGRKLAEKISRELAAEKYTVVSGLARGIDTAAHQGALSGGTAAVLAGGIDVVYPKENQELYEQISEQGVIVAESPLGAQPQARHFPRRNRIVSGLSLGTAVIEAAMKSGSLITARMAGEQGRDVFAVPGSPLDPRAQGANYLLKDGAVLIESARDIIQHVSGFGRRPLAEPELPGLSGQPPAVPDISEAEAAQAREKVLEILDLTPIAVDEIIRECQFSTAAVLAALLELELAGRILRHPGNKVSQRIE